MNLPLPGDIDPCARRLIRHKVRRLISQYGFAPSDRPDLEQELALHAHVSSSKYDPSRGSAGTFYERVLSNKATSLVHHAYAQRRDRRRERPFSDLTCANCTGADSRLDLKLDVTNALVGMPEDTRLIAVLFGMFREAEVARRSGLTRQRVRGLRHRIARHLSAAGLGPE